LLRVTLAAASVGAAITLAVLSSRTAHSAGYGTWQWQQAISTAQKLRETGKNEKADFHMQRAFALAKQLGVDHPFYTITLRHLSDTAYQKYQFDASRKYSLRELELLRPLGADYQDLVPVLLRLAELDIYEAKFDSALKYLKEAKDIKAKAVYNPLLRAEINARFSLLALGENNDLKYNEYRNKAQQEWTDSVKEPKCGSNFSEYGLELAHISEHAVPKMRKPLMNAAMDYAIRGIAIMRRASGAGNVAFVHGQNRLATIYKLQHRDAEAMNCWKTAASAALPSEMLTDRDKFNVLFTYGKPLVQKGRNEEALQFLEPAFRYTRGLDDPHIYADYLAHFSAAYVQVGRNADAIRVKRELVDLLDKLHLPRAAAQQRAEIEALNAAATPRIK